MSTNFLNQLAKGFVRSAVNQVGRDTGRAISGSIYTRSERSSRSIKMKPIVNWQASEPVYVVGPPLTSTDVRNKDGDLVSFGVDAGLPQEWVYENMNPVIYETRFVDNLYKLFWLFLLPIYAELFLIVRWAHCISMKTVTYVGVQNIPVYILDATLKVGYRQTGYLDKSIFVELPAYPHQTALMVKGSISLLLAFILGFLHYTLILKIINFLQ